MKESRSFTEYVKNCLDNQLWRALEEYLAKTDPSELDLRFNKVKKPGEIELYDTDVKFVDVTDLPGSMISFDVVLDATLIIYDEDRYHNDDSESNHQWFMISCQGDLDKRLSDMEITGIEEYCGRTRKDGRLSDSLVPVICRDDLERVADDFLKKYYPEARLQPMWVDPSKLAKRMGLAVIPHTISENGTVFGQIYFRETDATLYDEKQERTVTEHVMPRTIVVDPDVVFQRNLGAYNNTIVHECVHWYCHKKAFSLEQLYNQDASLIRCKVMGGVAGKGNESTKWMEWQANSLAPKIQMPLQTFKRKAVEYIRKYREELGIFELCELMPFVIQELATYFMVSRMAAKIRMIDAGYEEAAGAFTWIDGHYVKPYTYKKGSIQRNQTYSISAEDAAILSVTNASFREKTADGSFIYVDSHFVLNHPKYLYYDADGNVQMTDYARYHVNECCIVFDISLKTSDVDKHYHTECFLNRDQDSPFTFEIKFADGIDEKQKEKLLEEQIVADAEFSRTLPNDFCLAMKKCMKWRNMSNAKLARITDINEKTIGRILNGTTQGEQVNLVIMCLGLHLPPPVSHIIMELSPHPIRFNSQDAIWYDFAMNHLYTKPISEIRAFLQDRGCTVI